MASLPLRRQTMRRLAVLHRHCGAAHTQSTRELVASYSTASFASHTAIGTSRLHTSTPADNAASSAAAAAAATTRGNAAAASGGAAAASSSAAAAATGASVASGSSGSAVESLEGNGDIIVRRFPEGLTHLVLNRSQALNALSLDCVSFLRKQLPKLDGPRRVLLLTGSGEKSFCAGGDVRRLGSATLADVRRFFAEEYTAVGHTARLTAPLVSLWKGLTMGGGVGLSVHGRFRVSTCSTIFAMPETAIGLFPDIGASHFLPRLQSPGLGLYLGLTGTRLNGKDLIHHGLATHFIHSSLLPSLQKHLEEMSFSSSGATAVHRQVHEVLDKFASTSPPSSSHPVPSLSAERLASIGKYFAAPTSIRELIHSLERDAPHDKFADESGEISPSTPGIDGEEERRRKGRSEGRRGKRGGG
eukprot:GHVT01028237.1.p1 GENE.GHVT01028237.1~~GHVT01028237.1.p1  ORF type:complete len:416 (+),score=95.88 GHVT01028237.1:231-1478(+)